MVARRLGPAPGGGGDPTAARASGATCRAAAPLPSTVLMTALPAIPAGVARSSCARRAHRRRAPPRDPRRVAIAGVRGLRVGGAQAVAALAYGTESIGRVDKVVGPGSIWPALAKHEVAMDCGVDSFAGPTEVAIVADDTAPPAYVAADLVAQAEHDPLATAILITPSEALVDAVNAALEPAVAAASPRGHREGPAATSGARSWSTTSTARWTSPTPSRRSTSSSDRRRRPAAAARSATPAPSSSAGDPGRARRLRGRLEPRPADRRDGALRVPAARRRLHQVDGRHPVRPGLVSKLVAPALPPAIAKAEGFDRARARRRGQARRERARSRSADDLRGVAPYRAPQVDAPVRLNTNESPWPPSGGFLKDLGRADIAFGAEPLPGPGSQGLAFCPRGAVHLAWGRRPGRQRLQRDHPDAAPCLRRSRPAGTGVQPHLRDVPTYLRRHGHGVRRAAGR